jgi:hypothetical protein
MSVAAIVMTSVELVASVANPRRLRMRRLVAGQIGFLPGRVHEIVLYVAPAAAEHWPCALPPAQAQAPFTHPAELGSPSSLVHTSGGACAAPQAATHPRKVPRESVSAILVKPAAHVQSVLPVDKPTHAAGAAAGCGVVAGVTGAGVVAGVTGAGVVPGVATGVAVGVVTGVAPGGGTSHL